MSNYIAAIKKSNISTTFQPHLQLYGSICNLFSFFVSLIEKKKLASVYKLKCLFLY